MKKKFTIRLAVRVLTFIITFALFSGCELEAPGTNVLAVKLYTFSDTFLKGGVAHFFAEVIGVADQDVIWAVLGNNGEELSKEQMIAEGLEFTRAPNGVENTLLRRAEIFLTIPENYPHSSIKVRAAYANARLVENPRNYGVVTIKLIPREFSERPSKLHITNVHKGYSRESTSQLSAEVDWGDADKPENPEDIDLEAVVWHIVAGNTHSTNIGKADGKLSVDKFQRIGANLIITATLIHFGISDSVEAIVYPDFYLEITAPKEGVVRGEEGKIDTSILVSSTLNDRNYAVRWSIQNVGYKEDENGRVIKLGRPARAIIDKDGVLTVSDTEPGDEYNANSKEGYLIVEAASWEYPDITERCKVTVKGSTPKTPATQKIRFIHAGNRSTFALDWDGFLWSWGYGGSGILADGTTSNRTTPEQVNNTIPLAFVTSGGSGDEPKAPLPYALAIAEDGTLWAWGSNEKGKTGLKKDSSFESKPMQVGTNNQWVHVSAGTTHSLGVQKDGTLWAWGESPYTGLGAATPFVAEPKQVGTSTNWMFAAAGEKHSAAVQKDGTLWVWGSNSEFQLGSNNSSEVLRSPRHLNAFDNTRIHTILTGRGFSAAIDENGVLWVWGAGSPDKKPRTLPEKVSTSDVVLHSASLHTTGDHIFAIDTKGKPYGFGNSDGMLGEPVSDTFVLLSELLSVTGTSISAGSAGRRHILALSADYSIFAIGDNLYGEAKGF